MTFIILLLGMVVLISSLFLKPRYIYIGLSAAVFYLYFWMMGASIFVYGMFIIGLLLLLVELYIPGFGIVGILGALGTVTSLYNTVGDSMEAALLLVSMIITAVVTAYAFSKSGKELILSPDLVLGTSLKDSQPASSKDDLIGKNGLTITALRPVGRAKIDEIIYDVISETDMIEADVKITVKKIDGLNIYVQKEK